MTTVMTPERYLRLIRRLGLSQRGAARFLGISDRTSRRFAAGTSSVDPATAMLLSLMIKHGITPDDALRSIGIDPAAAVRRAPPMTAPRYYEESTR